MIHLIGIGKDVDLNIRSALSISATSLKEKLLIVSEFSQEVVIISTCNRTEIYLNSSMNKDDLITKVFTSLDWPLEYKRFTFYCEEYDATSHLLEVSCGFHSKILGEDQILGQIKEAYENSVSLKLVSSDLMKLFNLAVSCGKEFKTTTMLYKIPVSYSSIAVQKALSQNKKNFLIIGFGNMAQLALNYLISKISAVDTIYIAVRNFNKVIESEAIRRYIQYIENKKIKIISIDSMISFYDKVDTILCCTSSSIPIVLEKDLPNIDLLIFDLSLPINVEATVKNMEKVTLYNIDVLHMIDEENKASRKEIMETHKAIIYKYLSKYYEYEKLKNIRDNIIILKLKGTEIAERRYKVYKNKKYTKDIDVLVETLLESTSKSYVNKAIEVLKEETLKGNGEIALSIIEKIFGRCQ
jgi:glutamyl-tRNA reductase